jgi:hypothetical protein
LARDHGVRPAHYGVEPFECVQNGVNCTGFH